MSIIITLFGPAILAKTLVYMIFKHRNSFEGLFAYKNIQGHISPLLVPMYHWYLISLINLDKTLHLSWRVFLKAFLFSSVFMVNLQSKYKNYELNSVEIPCMWPPVPVNKTKEGFFWFLWGSNNEGQKFCVQKVCDHNFGISEDDLGGQFRNSVSYRGIQ